MDDSPAIRQSIPFWIESKTDWEVCGEAGDGKAAVHLVERLNPDFVILDVAMPVMDGLQAADKIVATLPNTQIILFTSYASDLLREHALRVGIAKSPAQVCSSYESLAEFMDLGSKYDPQGKFRNELLTPIFRDGCLRRCEGRLD